MRKFICLVLATLLMGCVRPETYEKGLTGMQAQAGSQRAPLPDDARLTGLSENLLASQLTAQAGAPGMTSSVGETVPSAPAAGFMSGYVGGKNRSHLTKPRQAEPPGFQSPASLAQKYKYAVSIEIRVKDALDYEAAKKYYVEAIDSTYKFNDYSTSWDYKTPDNRRVEILVINISALTKAMSSKTGDGVIAFIEIGRQVANSKDEMMAVNELLNKLYGIEVTENVNEGPIGPRDVSLWKRNAVRSVLRKPKAMLMPTDSVKNELQEYDGVIINPPVP